MRSPRRLLLVAASSLAVIAGAGLPSLVQAQDAAAVSANAMRPSDPWAHEISDIPADSAVRFGQLPNGLRYAIVRNTTPPGQASLRVRIDAGSLMENDDQLGLAHFIEHMAFNGSTNIPEGELTRTLERLGLAFGADTNASTGFDETVYKLDLPQTDEETVDTSLMILRDMLGNATLSADAIDRERGIVLSEERTRAGPGLRSVIAQLDFFLKDQLVPDRLPIGSTSVLANAPRERFVEFYSAYYRPSRATVIAVGDFDVDVMEAKIIATFGDWQNPAADGAEPVLGTVQPRSLEAGSYIEAGVQPSIQITWVNPPDTRPDTMAVQREGLVEGLGLRVLNRRLQRLARGENPPFIGASGSRSNLFGSAEVATVSAVYQDGNWDGALAAIDQEQRRIVEFGITQEELDREITEIRTALEENVAGAATRRTPNLANSLAASVNNDEVFTAPETDLAMFEAIVADLTLDEVNDVLNGTFTGQGPLIFVTGPDAIEGGDAAILAAYEASQQTEVAALEAEARVDWPYTEFGTPGTVASTEVVEDIGTTFVTFDNGVRLTIKPTDFTDDQVLVSIRTGTGFLSLPTDEPTAALALGQTFGEGGLGLLTAEQLETVLSGKVYGVSLSADEESYRLSGTTRPEDLDLQMQVLTAYLTDAGWRPEPFERARGQFRLVLPQLDATTGGVFARDGSGLLRSGDARWTIPTLEQIAEWSIDDLRTLVSSDLSQGPIEVIIVGDVDVDAAIQSVAATVGSLPARGPAATPSAEARTSTFPDGTAQPVELKHGGRADQALGFVAWPTGDNFSNPREARMVRLLADVLRLRLIDELREGQAVTYSPQVSATASGTFEGYGYMSAAIEAPPEKLEGFFADVDQIAADLVANPVTEDELERARRPRVEALRRSQNTNGFWMSELQDAQTDPERLPTLRSALSDMESATPADLQAVARKYLVPSEAYRIQVTPRAQAEAEASTE
ncbi:MULTISPECIES: M16 family metallopeptidase [unclassified Brevundimonas]|jgi:zinc protease|uniref:M16 family metallopeptidase n=1 Tax=unclassified Brevundimonas TaxID=2622653 RepID=UPI000C421C22|nr:MULTISPECIES: M16 family metallopeptidase [unclassified Brevundimonas]MAL88539.1 peptidase M16 [Brevundimonas sp.]|tara:strand:+ start:5132 stop:8032 length:2901 start_codon:yes stop_codon:yes gene_type:complete